MAGFSLFFIIFVAAPEDFFPFLFYYGYDNDLGMAVLS